MRKELYATVRQGGIWHPMRDVPPPYAAILYPDGRIWDCHLQRWRRVVGKERASRQQTW